MFSVLIADDEWIEREGISMLLGESGYEFQIYMAENGEEALKCLEKHSIDIVFTDVKMPFMDGLTFLKELRKENDKIKVAVFSAFADFEYAQKAMAQRVEYYFLKPVDPEEFQTKLKKMISDIEKERDIGKTENLMMNVLEHYLQEKGNPPNRLAEWMAGHGICRPILLDLRDESENTILAVYETLSRQKEWYLGIISEGMILILIDSINWSYGEQWWKRLLDNSASKNGCLVFGRVLKSILDLPELYREMEEQLSFHFFGEGNQLLTVDEKKKILLSTERRVTHILEEIDHGIAQLSWNYVRNNLNILFEELRNRKQDSQIYIKYIYADIVRKLAENDKEKLLDCPHTIERVFEQSTLLNIHKLVIDQITEMIQLEENRKSKKNEEIDQNSVIRQVKMSIENRYQEDLSLQILADEVFLTPTYLSYLFKKNMGVSLIKYLTTVRINQAKELLKNTNMKIADIAKQTGYQNDSYFSIAFKNNVGMSPGAFREREAK